MYLIRTNIQPTLTEEAMKRKPFGPGFSKILAETADRMEVWGTSFDDDGPDCCVFRLFKGNKEIATTTVNDY